MAMSCKTAMSCKSCHTIVHLSLRAIATPRRIFTGSVTKSKSLISGEKQRLVHKRESFVISNHYFSTLTDVVANFKKRFQGKISKLLKYERKSDERLKPTIQLPQPPAEFSFKIHEIHDTNADSPQPPPDFPFNIHETSGEDKIRLTRELAGDNILIEACCYFNDVKKSTQNSSFFGSFLHKCAFLNVIADFSDEDEDEDEDFTGEMLAVFFVWLRLLQGSSNKNNKDDLDYHKLQVKFTVTNPNEKGSKVENTEFRFKSVGKRIEFSESKDSDTRKHWREFPAIRGYDEDVIRFLIVFMVRRNKRITEGLQKENNASQ